MNLKTIFACLLLLGTGLISYSQINFNAVFSTKGQVYYSISMESFSIEINSAGKVIAYTAKSNEKIMYGINNRIESIAGQKVSRDHLTRISGIGDLKVEYDMENRIVAIGSNRLTYDFISKRLNSINKQPIEYDFLNGRVVKVASATIKYNLNGDITNIDDKDKLTSVRALNQSGNEL
jgi:hypothetical protein